MNRMTSMRMDDMTIALNECRRFVKKEIRDQVLSADSAADQAWAKAIWNKSTALDLPGLLVPEANQGVEASPLYCALLLDVIAGDCAGIASLFAVHFSACLALLKMEAGSRYSVLQGIFQDIEKAAPFISLILPSETEAPALTLSFTNNQPVLAGRSPLAAGAWMADYFLVFPTADESAGEVHCCLVHRKTPGVSIGPTAQLPGLKVNHFAPVVFDQTPIDPDLFLSNSDPGRILFTAAQEGLYGFTAAMAMGTARRALEKAIAYAEARYQFGKTIINHGEIRRILGEMRMKLCVGTAAYTNWFSPPPLPLPHAALEAGLTKAYCTDAALEIILDAIQIHGGYGYLHDYGLEKSMRDAKVLQLLGGSNPRRHIQAVVTGNS